MDLNEKARRVSKRRLSLLSVAGGDGSLCFAQTTMDRSERRGRNMDLRRGRNMDLRGGGEDLDGLEEGGGEAGESLLDIVLKKGVGE